MVEWAGPFQIGPWLRGLHEDAATRPPEVMGSYVISVEPWAESPTPDARVLYVGGLTGKSGSLRHRLGDLVSDGFGFFNNTRGRHSGAQTLYTWCCSNNVSLFDLWVGWCRSDCHRCAEVALYEMLRPKLNKVRPSRCRSHQSPLPLE